MSSPDNLQGNHHRFIVEVDISNDDNDKPIENSNGQNSQKSRNSKRQFNEIDRTDDENDIQPERKRKRTKKECTSAQGNHLTSETAIEVIDISDDDNETVYEVHHNSGLLKDKLINKEKQLEICEQARIDMNTQIREKDNALDECKKKLIEQEKYIQRLISAHNYSTIISQLQQPEILQQETVKKQSLNISSLPPEILTKILSQLCTFDVLRKVALVSRQFNELSKSPASHLYVSVSFRANKKGAVKFLQSTTMIKRLDIFRPDFLLWNNHRNIDWKQIYDNDRLKDEFRTRICDHLVLAVTEHSSLKILSCQRISEEAIPSLQRAKWWGNLTNFIYPDRISVQLEAAVTSKSCIKRFDKVELKTCKIRYRKDFTIPQMEVSSIQKLDLDIFCAVPPKEFNEAFAKDRFPNVIETNLISNQSNHEKQNFPDLSIARRNDLAVAMLKSIPNVKKLHIASNHKLDIKILEAISNHCQQLEFLTLEANIINEHVLYTDEELSIGIPSICKGLPNLRFLHFQNWNIGWKDARKLLLHSQQLQAILNNRHLMVRSTAQMSEVSRFLTEVEMTKISKILDLPEHYYGDNLKLLFNIFTEISFY